MSSGPRSSFAITIDVDSLRFYRMIHGLEGALPIAEDPIYRTAMPRFFDLISELGIRATLFLVGADAPQAPALGPSIRATGCEVASHSFGHDYGLTTRDRAAIAADLAAADQALAPLSDQPIAGFRAPGYNVTPALLEAVQARGYAYDSSLLPAPSYFLARGAAIGLHRLRGRSSSSLVGTVRQFAGPLEPYRTTTRTPWRPDTAGGLVEIPMVCDPWLRVPLIGTALNVLPPAVFNAGLRWAERKLSCINFEMHAIDLLDATDHPALRDLARFQRDLWVPAAEKLGRLRALCTRLAGDRAGLCLREVAADLRA